MATADVDRASVRLLVATETAPACAALLATGNDALDSAKTELVRACGVPWEHTLTQVDPVPTALLRCVRLLAVNQTELYFAEGDPAVGTVSLSPRNETETLVTLRKAYRQLLKPCVGNTNSKARVLDAVFSAGIALLLRRSHELVASLNSFTANPSLEDQSYTRLRQELASAGAMGVEDVRIVDGCQGTGRGLVAARALEVAEGIGEDDPGPTELLAIPYTQLVTVDAARASPTAGPALTEIEGLDDDTTLLLFIVHEAFVVRAQSRWCSFWNCMPETFSTGLYMPSEDMDLLAHGAPELAAAIQAQQVGLERAHATLFPALSDYYPTVFPAAIFSLDRMRWARALLDSRELLIRRRGALVSCLVPVLDMLNHAAPAHCWHRRFDDAHDMLRVELNCPVPAGGQVFLAYGGLRNWQFLQFYGFVPENNPYDAIDLHLGEPADLGATQQALCAKYRLTPDHTIRAGPAAPACLAFLRVAVSTTREQRQMELQHDPRSGPVSAANEEKACMALRTALEGLRRAWRPELTDRDLLLQTQQRGRQLAHRLLVLRYRRSQLDLLDAALRSL